MAKYVEFALRHKVGDVVRIASPVKVAPDKYETQFHSALVLFNDYDDIFNRDCFKVTYFKKEEGRFYNTTVYETNFARTKGLSYIVKMKDHGNTFNIVPLMEACAGVEE